MNNFVKGLSSVLLGVMLLVFFGTSFMMSALFWVSDLHNLNNQAMLAFVVGVQITKLMLALTVNMYKNYSTRRKVKFILKTLLFISIIESVSFFMVNNASFNPSKKFFDMLGNYVPLLGLKQHFILIANASLSIICEYMIIFLPVTINNLWKINRLGETVEELSYFEKVKIILTNPVKRKIDLMFESQKLNSGTKKELRDNRKPLNLESFDKTNPSANILTQSSPVVNEVSEVKRNEAENDENLTKKLRENVIELRDYEKNLTQELGDGLGDLVKQLREYITRNYSNGETLNTKMLREEFNLTEHQWKKVKRYLNVETVGTKTKVML